MNTPTMYPKKLTKTACLLFAIAATAFLLTGCGKSEEQIEHDDHAAHSHESASEKAVMAGFVGVNHSHEAEGETCFICDASKREQGRLWCREHGRYEDRCWLCHPELEDKDRLFCKEHGLYEDECHLCRPEVSKDQASAANLAYPIAKAQVAKPETSELWCKEHNVAERECGICQPDLAQTMRPGENLKVRFPSEFSADKVGIRTQSPQAMEVQPSVGAYCETQYNLNALAKITPLAGGVISQVYRDLGDRVSSGDPILEIHSAAVAQAKSDFLSAVVVQDIAKKSFDRLTRLQEQSIAAEKDLLQAEAEFRSAKLAASNLRQRLQNLGLSLSEIQTVEREQDTSALLTIRAPFEGTLVTRNAVVGEAVELGHELYTLADLSKSWLELTIPTDSMGQVKIGQPVVATFSELPGIEVTGRITWVDTSIDPKTRMIRARAEVDSKSVGLTAGLFGDARIITGGSRSGAVLPRSAVQRYEGADFVFVRDSKDLFALRRVVLGVARENHVEIIEGVRPSDQVVTHGSFIAMSEFQKSRLGAGCAH